MNSDALSENRRALQNLIGLSAEQSEEVLDASILLTIIGNHPRLGEFLSLILGKTFKNVHFQPQPIKYSCEILTDFRQKRTDGPYIYIGQNDRHVTISTVEREENLSEKIHSFIHFLIACYSGALALKTVSSFLPFNVADTITIEIDTIQNEFFDKVLNVGKIHLVGAGAIGNSFLYALSNFQIKGELIIIDPDIVSGGNLNRCLFFDENNINRKKAEVLSDKAGQFFPEFLLHALPFELARIPNKPEGAWLNKLVVAVDSRRARRNIQLEIPKEVFDASTTGIEEVVLHHHKRPLNGTACLGCIYVKEKNENAHEIHIADSLGVSITEVQKQFVSDTAALLICKKYSSLDPRTITGLAYDTLFKALCGEGALLTNENKQVIAPLAFVSALAGAYLALMFFEAHSNDHLSFNYWRISPWSNTNEKLKQYLPKNENCEFCNHQTYSRIMENLWKEN